MNMHVQVRDLSIATYIVLTFYCDRSLVLRLLLLKGTQEIPQNRPNWNQPVLVLLQNL